MLKIGDRVSSQIDIGKPAVHYGVIVEIIRSRPSFENISYKLFTVKWDDVEEVKKGYFESGLQIER